MYREYKKQMQKFIEEDASSNNKDMIDYLLKVHHLFKNDYNKTECKPIQKKHGLHAYFKTVDTNNNKQLYEEYMSLMDKNYVKTTDTTKREMYEVCPTCNKTLWIDDESALSVCQLCGYCIPYIETGIQGLSYDEQVNVVKLPHFTYKRINHFQDLLTQVQAQQFATVPTFVIDRVKHEMQKYRIQTATPQVVKRMLKILKLGKYYEHCNYIVSHLGGSAPPRISEKTISTLTQMFTDIQEPYEKICPESRKNFFNYNYVIYKFCEIIKDEDIKQHFPLLKSKIKLREQDEMWKKICKIKHWEFIPTV